MSNLWENTYVCAEQYCCANALYLSSMLAHAYTIIIDRHVGSSGHGRYFFDGFNATDKWLISMLVTTVQLPGAEACDSHMEIYT